MHAVAITNYMKAVKLKKKKKKKKKKKNNNNMAGMSVTNNTIKKN